MSVGTRGFHNDDEIDEKMDLSAGLGGVPSADPPDGAEDEVPDVVSGGEGPEAGAGDGTVDGDTGAEAGPEGEEGPSEPDYGPGRDTIFRRETWPPYAYPSRKKLHVPMALLWSIAGLAAGLVLSTGIFLGIRAIQERMMYHDVEQMIRAQWPNMELTIRPGYHDDVVNAPYYGSDAWEALRPVENDDGSFTLEAGTSKEFCALILEMREYMDSLMARYTADEAYLGFGEAAPSLDYDVVTVSTQMHQSGFIDQEKAVVLLRQMKIHNLLYRAIDGEEPEVRLVFMNGKDTVLTMRM